MLSIVVVAVLSFPWAFFVRCCGASVLVGYWRILEVGKAYLAVHPVCLPCRNRPPADAPATPAFLEECGIWTTVRFDHRTCRNSRNSFFSVRGDPILLYRF